MPKLKRKKFEIKQKQKRRSKRKSVIHGITGIGKDVFNDLQKIVKKGFVGGDSPFVNAYITGGLSSGRPPSWSGVSNLPETKGDKYAIGMLTRVKRDTVTVKGALMPGEEVHVGFAHPEQIKLISIKINPLVSEVEEERRKQFYRKKFPQKRIEFK